MDNIYVSIYTFGYSANFINDNRRQNNFNIITPKHLIDICNNYSLGGIELPIDKYYPEFNSKQIVSLLNLFYKNNLGVKIDFENFSKIYIKDLIPILCDYGIDFIRTKVSNFYGCNRYKHPEFHTHYNHFIRFLKDIFPTLEKYRFKILLENHQDIIIDDYFKIWEDYSSDLIGINWDIGNSLPALESPNDFLKKMYSYIGNIHLKDYKIYRSKNGYRLARCPLGKGIVDFNHIFSFLKINELEIPMTIELGAMNSRYSDIYKDTFWEALPEVNDARKRKFIKYIESNYNFYDKGKSSWENKNTPDEIFSSEMNDLNESVKFLKNISINKA